MLAALYDDERACAGACMCVRVSKSGGRCSFYAGILGRAAAISCRAPDEERASVGVQR